MPQYVGLLPLSIDWLCTSSVDTKSAGQARKYLCSHFHDSYYLEIWTVLDKSQYEQIAIRQLTHSNNFPYLTESLTSKLLTKW